MRKNFIIFATLVLATLCQSISSANVFSKKSLELNKSATADQTKGGAWQGATQGISCGGTSDFQPEEDFSVSAWININIPGKNSWVTAIVDRDETFYLHCGGGYNKSGDLVANPSVEFWTRNNNKDTNIVKKALSLHEWHHVVGTYKQGTGTTVYVDGKASHTANKTGNAKLKYGIPKKPLSIGRLWNHSWKAYGGGFNGNISEVGIFNKALTHAEIAAIHSGKLDLRKDYGAYKTSGNLIGYWKLDEGSGSAAKDYSGHNGIVHGSPKWSDGTAAATSATTTTASGSSTDTSLPITLQGAKKSDGSSISIKITSLSSDKKTLGLTIGTGSSAAKIKAKTGTRPTAWGYSDWGEYWHGEQKVGDITITKVWYNKAIVHGKTIHIIEQKSGSSFYYPLVTTTPAASTPYHDYSSNPWVVSNKVKVKKLTANKATMIIDGGTVELTKEAVGDLPTGYSSWTNLVTTPKTKNGATLSHLYEKADSSGTHTSASGSGTHTSASGSGTHTSASGSGTHTSASGSGTGTRGHGGRGGGRSGGRGGRSGGRGGRSGGRRGR